MEALKEILRDKIAEMEFDEALNTLGMDLDSIIEEAIDQKVDKLTDAELLQLVKEL